MSTIEEVTPLRDTTTALLNIEFGDENNDCPIEEVRLTVPTTDDPSIPALTFRTWILGFISCVVLAFLNQFFAYRQNKLYISSIIAQIVTLPLGKLMARYLPSRAIKIRGTRWSFSLNPGPFTLKEHVLITIFANSGSDSVFAVSIITIVKAFYHQGLHPVAAMMLTQTTQLMGYGWAGIFRKFLVDSPYMWWPQNLVQVSLFRALHETEKRHKGGMTRFQFFLVVFVASFSYYTIPNYLFPSISTISLICLIFKNSVIAQQIGSGVHGLGIGSFGLDWSTICGFLGSPLSTPVFAIINVMVGFFVVVYVILPIAYWTNTYDARKFPIISSNVFMGNGSMYNVTEVLDEKSFTFDKKGYDSQGPINLSFYFVLAYGLSFAALAATLSHVALFNGRTIWRQTKSAFRDQFGDIHTRLMKKNYKSVPEWWFQVILVAVIALAIFSCEGFDKQLQLPFWGVLLAAGVAFLFTLPIGIITAQTNQGPSLNVIAELIIGYIYPGRPLANLTFKTYSVVSMSQAITFLQDFKLGHYMKIPPRSMFVVQLAGTIVASSVYFGTSCWLLETVDGICDQTMAAAEGSPWTCPLDHVYYNASIIWGVVGPLRLFGRLGRYAKMNYFFLGGLLAPLPVWIFFAVYPNKKWIKLINMPIIIGATTIMPPAQSVNFLMWGLVGLVNFFVFRRYKEWWARHNYVLSAGIDAGVALMAMIAFVALQGQNIEGINWWGLERGDHCPLAECPTAPGIKVNDICPVFT